MRGRYRIIALGLCAILLFGVVALGERPAIETILPDRFGFGVSSFGGVLDWPAQVKASHGINWDFLYWYQMKDSSQWFLEAKLARAANLGAMPVITHYQLYDRGKAAGYSGDHSWDIVIKAVQDPIVMRDYFDNVKWIMQSAGNFGQPTIFQTEPDSTTWLRQYHTEETNDATQGYVAVAASGHPDLKDLPDTIAGYAQALVRLRDLYAPDNVYMGLCEFDNVNGWHPERSVTFIQSLGARFDILFTHHTIKYSTKGEGWWDAFSETDHARFLNWIGTITDATGLKYIHWQAEIGATDYGLMPDYPSEERISDLIAAGSVATLFDLYTLDGPPHHQPQHGYTSSPPPDHPAYNSLDKLAERLQRYYNQPTSLDPGIASFTDWAESVFTPEEQSDPAISGEEMDPDNDRVSNLYEYAFGLNPNSKDREGLPVIRIHGGDDRNIASYSFSRLPDCTDIEYHLWISTNMVSWTEKSLADGDIGISSEGDRETITISTTNGIWRSVFYKLEVRNIQPLD
ncbi:MAG: hypothetical protein K9M45_03250 [Kiritimatiellales bacterium]|nr:hypothetical protein [Kiritimatiellales bacterium]